MALIKKSTASGAAGQGLNKLREEKQAQVGGGGYIPASGTGAKALNSIRGSGTTYTTPAGQKKPGVYLDDAGETDYSRLINDAIDRGAGYQVVQDYLNDRYGKISRTPGLDKYTDDATARRAQDYISQGMQQEQRRQMEDGYARIAAEQAAAKRAAVEQAVNGLEGQKGTVEQSYADLFRQLYLDRRRSEKNLPQQMAAMGYTGGLTESSALALQTGYADALRQGEQQKTSTLTDIDRAITDARLSGDISIAEQAAQLAQQGLLSYSDLLRAQQEQTNWEKQFGFQQDQFTYQKTQDALAQENYLKSLSYQQLLNEISREDVSYERKLAAAQYLYEKTGDGSGLSMVGYTPEQIAALGSSFARAQQGATRYAGGSSGIDAGGPAPVLPTQAQYDEAADRFDAGDYSAEVINILLAANERPEDLAAIGGFTANPSLLGFGPVSDVYLKQLMAGGQVVAVDIGGVRYYKRAVMAADPAVPISGGGTGMPSRP